MKIKPSPFTVSTAAQPSQEPAPAASASFSSLVRNTNLEAPAVAKASAPDLKKAQESVHEVRGDLAELQRLESERGKLSAEKQELRSRIAELTAALQDAQMSMGAIAHDQEQRGQLLQELRNLFGMSDDVHSIQHAASELSKQLKDAQTRLREVDRSLSDNIQSTKRRSEEVSQGLDQARQLSGNDPGTTRFLDAVRDAVNRHAWPAALVRGEDAEKHLATRYRQALQEAAFTVKPADGPARR